MNNYKKYFENNNIPILNISYKNKSKIINTPNKKYLIKNKIINHKKIYDYLNIKEYYNYLPQINDYSNSYEIYPYIEEIEITDSEKANILISLISMLHTKTTTYEEITLDEIKERYEDISNKIDYLYKYYLDLQDYIESNIYMSPAEYLLIRNISGIYSLLNYSKKHLDMWYNSKEQIKTERHVLLHNNLKLKHILIGKNNYITNWTTSKKGPVIYDFINLYKNEYDRLDLNTLFNIYQTKYLYTESEMNLFLSLICIPDKIELNNTNYINTINIKKLIIYITKTHAFISEKNKKEQE